MGYRNRYLVLSSWFLAKPQKPIPTEIGKGKTSDWGRGLKRGPLPRTPTPCWRMTRVHYDSINCLKSGVHRSQSHVWDKSVSPQGCTSKPTPNWDTVGTNILGSSAILLVLCALFLLLSVHSCARSESGRVRACNTFAALTTNHLYRGDPWLVNSVPLPISGTQACYDSLRSKEKSWTALKRMPKQSRSFSGTRLLSASTSILPSSFIPNSQTCERETGGASNDGEVFTANQQWLDGRKTEPAEKRVLYSHIVGIDFIEGIATHETFCLWRVPRAEVRPVLPLEDVAVRNHSVYIDSAIARNQIIKNRLGQSVNCCQEVPGRTWKHRILQHLFFWVKLGKIEPSARYDECPSSKPSNVKRRGFSAVGIVHSNLNFFVRFNGWIYQSDNVWPKPRTLIQSELLNSSIEAFFILRPHFLGFSNGSLSSFGSSFGGTGTFFRNASLPKTDSSSEQSTNEQSEGKPRQSLVNHQLLPIKVKLRLFVLFFALLICICFALRLILNVEDGQSGFVMKGLLYILIVIIGQFLVYLVLRTIFG